MSQDATVVRTAGDDACRAVIDAVAAARGVRPIDLDTPLYEAVDPDALRALFPADGRPSATTVEFAWTDCLVTVADGGRVTVTRTGSR
ncbi:HalOD1 output domain-containing protein [Halobaculum litoreum]|uniref:HalOD1 output domain-containing protein n=1 Tax=Halobaculum litoreum TaxID=3031998 RepID=A0ABD5XPR8_9EURY